MLWNERTNRARACPKTSSELGVVWNKWYKDKLRSLSILPLPMYKQINNILLLSKLLSCRYDTSQLSLPSYSTLSRFVLFQPERPKKILKTFFNQSCRLADIFKIDLLNHSTLKKELLKIFWGNFHNYNKMNKCSWKLTCDCTLNNCRDKTKL